MKMYIFLGKDLDIGAGSESRLIGRALCSKNLTLKGIKLKYAHLDAIRPHLEYQEQFCA
jgi:hypothetical protein